MLKRLITYPLLPGWLWQRPELVLAPSSAMPTLFLITHTIPSYQFISKRIVSSAFSLENQDICQDFIASLHHSECTAKVVGSTLRPFGFHSRVTVPSFNFKSLPSSVGRCEISDLFRACAGPLDSCSALTMDSLTLVSRTCALSTDLFLALLHVRGPLLTRRQPHPQAHLPSSKM